MRIAEYRDVKDECWSEKTVVRADGRYSLLHQSPGWECAGSMARLRETECWSACCDYPNPGWSGHSFKTRAEAEAMLNRWIEHRDTPQVPAAGFKFEFAHPAR